MAYVLGFFAADGSMYTTRRDTHFVTFEITDGALLHSIRELLESNHKITPRYRDAYKVIYRLQIGSKVMFADLEKLGFMQCKSKVLLFPKIPKQFAADFIRGYFDGDGHVWSGMVHKDRPRPSRALFTGFTSGSEKFLSGLKEVLRSFRLEGGSLCNCSGAFRLQYSTADSLKLYALMYYDSRGLCLERKQKIFKKFLRMRA